MQAALSGIKVMDFSTGVAGPHAGSLCVEHGADVVKVEPIGGDWGRSLGPVHGDLCGAAVVYNRGKRSMSVDLKDPEVLRVVAAMVAEADVVIEAFRPGVMKRLGLDYETVRKTNPDVVYLSVTGFGQKGPLSKAPATDGVLQAFSGFMHLNKDATGHPQRLDMIIIDVLTGLYGYQAISSALMKRFRFGGGAYIDCNLLQCALAFQAFKIVEDRIDGGVKPMYVPLGIFATSDGNILLSVMRDNHFEAMCEAIGQPEVAHDPRYSTRSARLANADGVNDMLHKAIRTRTTDEWCEIFTRYDVLNARVLEYGQVVEHEQSKVIEAFDWISQNGLEKSFPLARVPGGTLDRAAVAEAPHLGADTRAILSERGLSDDAIADLVARGMARLGS